jgi:hypothetical protein
LTSAAIGFWDGDPGCYQTSGPQRHLACPTGINGGLERKSVSPELSNLPTARAPP